MVKAIKKGPEEIENGKLKIENEGDN